MTDIAAKVASYYGARIAQYGPTPAGVDWNSDSAQHKRFEILLRAVGAGASLSVLDYGCGYGALAPVLHDRHPGCRYVGYDMVPEMIVAARRNGAPDAHFTTDRASLVPADVAIASGVFNVKGDTPLARWEDYVLETLHDLASLATQTIAFNMLTAFSDPQRMRSDLYYGDPYRYFEWCRTHFGRWIALYHDYGLFEFTLIARRQPESAT